MKSKRSSLGLDPPTLEHLQRMQSHGCQRTINILNHSMSLDAQVISLTAITRKMLIWVLDKARSHRLGSPAVLAFLLVTNRWKKQNSNAPLITSPNTRTGKKSGFSRTLASLAPVTVSERWLSSSPSRTWWHTCAWKTARSRASTVNLTSESWKKLLRETSSAEFSSWSRSKYSHQWARRNWKISSTTSN